MVNEALSSSICFNFWKIKVDSSSSEVTMAVAILNQYSLESILIDVREKLFIADIELSRLINEVMIPRENSL